MGLRECAGGESAALGGGERLYRDTRKLECRNGLLRVDELNFVPILLEYQTALGPIGDNVSF